MRQVVVRGQPVELPMPGMIQVEVRRRPVAAREPAGQVKLGRPGRDLPGLIRINRPAPLQKPRLVAHPIRVSTGTVTFTAPASDAGPGSSPGAVAPAAASPDT